MARRTTAVSLAALFVLGLLLSNASGMQNSAQTRQQMTELGLSHKTAWDLYQELKQQAGGGNRLAWNSLPDWSGVYTRGRGGLNYDPDQPRGALPPAKLTPEYQPACRSDSRM